MATNYNLPKPVAGTPRAGEEVSLMVDVSDTVADIDTRITTEASDRATGDADTLAAANTYTDTAVDNATSSATRVWVPAPDFFINFGAPSQNGNRGIPNWLMDAALAESLIASCSVPASWTVQGYIWWANAGGGAGDVKWDIRSETYTAGETPNTSVGGQPATNANLIVTAGAQNVIVRTPAGGTGVVPDEILRSVVTRQAAAAEDTLANDVYFFGIELVKVS